MSDQSESRSVFDEVADALSSLSPSERRVLILYFGLQGGEPLSIHEVAVAMALPVAVVEELKERAMQRLRGGGGPDGAAMALNHDPNGAA